LIILDYRNGESVACGDGREFFFRVLVVKPERKRQLGRSKLR
jgi:hypothetical protein